MILVLVLDMVLALISALALGCQRSTVKANIIIIITNRSIVDAGSRHNARRVQAPFLASAATPADGVESLAEMGR